MPPACLRHTELPNSSKLFVDFVYHFDRLAQFYRYNPWDSDSYVEAALKLDYPDDRRAALVGALRELNGDSPALELLAKPGTVAVVTGQQVGLFSGPCYTVYKALTAVRVAERLNQQGVPAVPIFWLATEDHDFEEVNHAYNFNAAHVVSKQRVVAEAGQNRPVGSIPVADFPLAELKAVLADFPFGADVFAMVEQAHAGAKSLGDSFLRLVREILKDYGLLYVDPLQASIRKIAAPLLEEAFLHERRLVDLLLERDRELESAGYHAQVHVDQKTSLFFHLKAGVRSHLKAGERPESFADLSPNALLRPVVQDYLLPTVALIGGPAEVAYLAQTEVIYRQLNRPMPVVLPRSGFTLLDARAQKLMTRYGLTIKDFFEGLEPLKQKIAAQLVPVELKQQLAKAEADAKRLIVGLRAELLEFDPTLAASFDKSGAKIVHHFEKIQAKTGRETLRRDERASAEAMYLYSLLFDDKHLQERHYTILPFLAKHGPELIPLIYESVRLDCPDHIVLTV